MSIIDDYIEFDKKYKNIYGNETVILMEVGDFFEMYGVQNDFETVGANLQEISDILNIRVTLKNKSNSNIDRKNPMMSGFPSYIVEKHIQTLIENQYTVVLVEQFENKDCKYYKQFDRKVSKIITPSTYFNSQSNSNNNCNYLMVCYWELLKQNSQECLSIGCSLVDIITGNTHFYECIDKNPSSTLCLEEVYRIIQMYNPSEVIHVSFSNNINKYFQKKIMDYLHTTISNKVIEKWNIDVMFKKVRYQEDCIRKVYKSQMTYLSPIDSLKLDMKPLAIISFCYMLQYVYEHDEKLVSHLLVPDEIQRNKHMSIEYNSIQQLNIKGQETNKGEKCLSKLLNRCITTFGKRKFWNWLINPIIDTQELNNRYDCIEYFLKNNLYINIRKNLKSVCDIQKFLRKISIEKVVPNEWNGLVSSFENISSILNLIHNSLNQTENIYNNLNINDNKLFCEDFRNYINENLNLDECLIYSNLNEVKTNIFKTGICEDLDTVNNYILNDLKFLNDISIFINKILGEEGCKLESNDKLGYHFAITKKRWDTFLAKLKIYKTNQEKTKYDFSLDLTKFQYKRENVPSKRKLTNITTEKIDNIEFDFSTINVKPISSSSNNLRITSSQIEEISNTIISNQQKLQQFVSNKYFVFLKELFDKYENKYLSLIKSISEIDVYCTNAFNSFEYSYNKPEIISFDNSFLIAKDIRHPIVERIQTQFKYVENDITLGVLPKEFNLELEKQTNGILLYGVNSSGKSTLMKSVGLNIIMAQAGMYVPCSSLKYSPYKHIFTRINGNDNIYRGMSSFTVEMTELKNILDRCNKNSLILGDELCSGTESVSALSIVASGILEILSKNGNFIFATHLHELCDIENIKELINNKLQVYHIHVDKDDDGNIIFNRKLKHGKGSSVYGLEICKYLKLPEQFLKNAEKIRKQVMDISTNLIEPKQSKYNSKIIVSSCCICGYIPNGGIPLETHHIIYQHTQDENGFVKLNNTNFHKNEEYNLVPLCQKCHDDEHSGILKIKGYIDTSNGKKLLYDKTNQDYSELKKHVSYEDKKWKFRKSPKGKWKIVNQKDIEDYLFENNINLNLSFFKS